MAKPKYKWERYSTERLLKLRFCDLKLKIPGSRVEKCIKRLYEELEQAGLRFRPHFWIAPEWFCPDGVPGIGLPFFLFHPRLIRLEEELVIEVEGQTTSDCMRLLRHEVGHAIDNAYRLRLDKKRQKLFGLSTTQYPVEYSPKPYSKQFVVNLDAWYAQAHPDEDWAETFAVWLNPKSNWRKRYARWGAIKKLQLVDSIMQRLKNKPMVVKNREKPDSIHSIKRTLSRHYRDKKSQWGLDEKAFFEQDLYRLFSSAPKHRSKKFAASFLQQERKFICKQVSKWTGQYQYTINQMLDELIQTCKEKKMHLKEGERATRLDVIGMLTAQTMNYLMSGRHTIPM